MPESDKDFQELLKMEYARYSDLMKHSEDSGDSRLTFYMSLVTAVIGGIVALFANKEPSAIANFQLISLLIPLSLTGLLMVGYVIYRRLVKRNDTTDDYKEKLDRITKLMVPKVSEGEYTWFRGTFPKRKKFAGIKDTVVIINCTIILFLIYVYIYLYLNFLSANNFDFEVAYLAQLFVLTALSLIPVLLHITTYIKDYTKKK